MISLPEITDIDNKDDKLNFAIRNIDVSVINSIRRTIMSNIPMLVFRGFPSNENNINIIHNTTKFNNEYMKQRISCIPIINNNKETYKTFMENYQVELDVTNETMEKLYVTTKDFKIKNKTNDKYLEQNEVSKLFPPDSKTGDYILICILYPNYNKKNEPNERLNFVANFDVGTSAENSCWNIVHHISYENVRDFEKIKQITDNIKKDKYDNKETEEYKYEKKDFEILDAQRITIPNQFKMTIQSIDNKEFSEKNIVKEACNIIMTKLGYIDTFLNNRSKIISQAENAFNQTNGMLTSEEYMTYNPDYCNIYRDENKEFIIFEIKKDDFTIGKLIEKYFFHYHNKKCNYIGFKKEHPTKKEAFIYIKYNKDAITDNEIYEDFIIILNELNKSFNKIKEAFN